MSCFCNAKAQKRKRELYVGVKKYDLVYESTNREKQYNKYDELIQVCILE